MKKVFILTAFLLLIGVRVYAANGDLVVNGNLCVGGKCADTVTSVPVWDYTVTGAAVTSITSPTLDGNAGGGYLFEFILYNPTASTTVYRMYVENDQTNTNYTTVRWGFNWAGDAYLTDQTGAGRETWMVGEIGLSPRGYVKGHWQEFQDANSWSMWTWRKNATISNLTRIDIVSSVTNGIGVGSRFRLWRRK